MKKLVIVFIGTITVILFASAAFAFVKIDATGTELPDSATDWVAVKDTSTGLVWEKKTVANKGDTYYILPPDLWADPKPPSDDPQYAINYINSLNNTPGLGGFTDWRIPTIRELATIIDFTKSSPAVNADYFQNMNNASYWTSTDYAKGGYDFGNSVYISGLAINFVAGSDYTIDKTAKIYIIAVRGTALPSPSFTPDAVQNVVKENNSGLVWQKAPGSATKTWADISAYLDTLPGVHVDNSVECYGWRLPTVQELRSVVNYEENSSSKPSVYSDFTASLANYWTSTENAGDTTKAWYIGFRYGKTGIAAKTTLNNVWAVVDKNKIVACPSYRIINLNGSLAFGNVNIGSTKQLTFTIGNSGNSTLTVSSIAYPAGFTGNWSGGAIAAGGSQIVTVTFAPNAAQTYSGTVTVNSDKTDGTNTISISGTGVVSNYTISGYVRDSNNIGIGGVMLTFSNSGGTVTTDTSGYYSKAFTAAWTGTVTPSKSGYNFSPVNLSYSNVTTNQANQNYTASGLKPIISVTPESHDFGDIPLQSSTTRSVRRSSDRAKRSDPQIQLSSEYLENQIIIKIKPALRSTREQSIMTSLNANVLAELPSVGAQVWQISGTVQDALNQYWNNPDVEYIEPNYVIRLNKTPNDPSFSELWGLNNTGQSGGRADADIDAPEAWDISTGSNVVVAVIDTGVDYNHPDLAANMWKNPGEIPNNGIDDDHNGYIDDVYGYDFANNDGDPYDDNRHGTHCAGTIAGSGNNGMGVTGVSWSGKIMALKFLTAGGSGSTSAAIKAVEYATKMGAKITSNSWGGGGYSSALYEAIQAAGQSGCLFIAAAGNGGLDQIGDDNDAQPNYPSNYNLSNIIAVASTDRNDIRSYFSNYGLYSVDLGSPGSSIYSTVPGNTYATLSGTSMATPHVSGVASLIWSAYPSLTAAQAKEALLSSVDPITALQGKTVSGGRLNAYNALMRAGQNQKTFTVSNTGNGSLIIGSLSVNGTNKSDFLIQNDTCSGKTVSSNGNCTVKVFFAPASVGTKTAYLSIPSNDSNAPVVNATLLGRGISNDTDNDGMSNSFESQYGFNPNNLSDASSDYDNDGLSNLSEYKMGTNPIRKDTDADGMPDGYEAVHSFDPLNPFDAQSDPDRDGLTNFQEYQNGTEPAPAGLSDVIRVLRVLTGISDGNTLGIADVNGDGKIGHEEVIYILQVTATLRP